MEKVTNIKDVETLEAELAQLLDEQTVFYGCCGNAFCYSNTGSGDCPEA